MEQLSGLDAAFINLETTSAPTHVGGIGIYDQSTAPGGRVTLGWNYEGLWHSLPTL